MIKRDYVLRLIEELAHTLHYALGLASTKEYEKGLEALDRAFGDFFGWDSNFVNAMPESYLLGMLTTANRLDVDKVTVLAVLLKAEGDILAERGEAEKAFHRYLRALRFSLAVSESGTPRALPEEFDRVEGLVEALAGYQLPPETQHRLWHYYGRTGQFARAEDTFWKLLAQSEADATLISEGIGFYEALLGNGDEVLAAGGLPRDEVEEALRELGRMR